MAVINEIGTIAIWRNWYVIFHTDAYQALVDIPIDDKTCIIGNDLFIRYVVQKGLWRSSTH